VDLGAPGTPQIRLKNGPKGVQKKPGGRYAGTPGWDTPFW